jgi:hypothetical protein
MEGHGLHLHPRQMALRVDDLTGRLGGDEVTAMLFTKVQSIHARKQLVGVKLPPEQQGNHQRRRKVEKVPLMLSWRSFRPGREQWIQLRSEPRQVLAAIRFAVSFGSYLKNAKLKG